MFQQAADAVGGTGAPHGLRAALAALQARTLARLRERDDDARRSPLEGLFAAQLNVTLAMLEQASAPLVDRLEAMHTQLAQRGWPAAAAAADPQQLAALALVQGWALGALVGGGSGAAAGAALASSGSGGGHTSVLGASHGLAKQLAGGPAAYAVVVCSAYSAGGIAAPREVCSQATESFTGTPAVQPRPACLPAWLQTLPGPTSSPLHPYACKTLATQRATAQRC